MIVERLNAPPFSRNLTLVSFHELANTHSAEGQHTGLLQILNDVFAECDDQHAIDAKGEPRDAMALRVVSFLQVLKYPVPADIDSYQALLMTGDPNSIYPILAYVLSKLPALKKRAYVARYLLPVEVPPEFMHDEGIQEALAQYRELQGEFKEAHKALEKAGGGAAGGKPSAADMRKEITQLEEERMQLVEKIASLKKRTTEIPGFTALLDATSSLRKEQEEEGKLQERMHEQRMALAAAERRYGEVNRRLAETRASTNEDMSAEAVLEAARREATEGRNLARKILPASLDARRETLVKLQRLLTDKPKTEEDLAALSREVNTLEDTVARLTQEVAASQRAAGDDKLAMFRQQSALIAKKLVQKEEAMELLRREAEALTREVEAKEAKLSELSGPRYMRREEFKAYAATLRTKTNTYKALKQELADVRQETVVLARTEQILKSRAGDLDEFLRKLEERRGVSGYTAVASDIEKISALKARIDESKGKTLNEISRIVTDINAAIREKKTKLAPAIKELRKVREEYAELEASYQRDKATYESIAVGMSTERSSLEKEANAAQEELMHEEGRYAYLQASLDILEAAVLRSREQAAYEKGSMGKNYVANFKSLKEVYESRLVMLEAAAKDLRRRQKDIRENSGAHAVQRTRFLDLRRLLLAKQAVYRADPTGGLGAADGADGGGRGGASAARVGVEFQDTGGANVMSLEL